MTGGAEDNFKIKIAVVLSAECRGAILTSKFSQRHDVCLAETSTNADSRDSHEGVLGGILTLTLDGEYIIEDNGVERITAVLDSTITSPVKEAYGDCPDEISTIHCKLELTRKADK